MNSKNIYLAAALLISAFTLTPLTAQAAGGHGKQRVKPPITSCDNQKPTHHCNCS